MKIAGQKDTTYQRKTHTNRPYMWRPFLPVLSLTHTKEETWPFLMSLEQKSMQDSILTDQHPGAICSSTTLVQQSNPGGG